MPTRTDAYPGTSDRMQGPFQYPPPQPAGWSQPSPVAQTPYPGGPANASDPAYRPGQSYQGVMYAGGSATFDEASPYNPNPWPTVPDNRPQPGGLGLFGQAQAAQQAAGDRNYSGVTNPTADSEAARRAFSGSMATAEDQLRASQQANAQFQAAQAANRASPGAGGLLGWAQANSPQATQAAINRPGTTPAQDSAAYLAMQRGGAGGALNYGPQATMGMLGQANVGAKGGGGGPLNGAAAGARASAAQFVSLAQSNPALAQQMADAGLAPTINGQYGGGWVSDSRGGNPAEQAARAAMARGVPAASAGGPAQTVPTQMTPAFFRAGWREKPDGTFYNEVTGYDPNPPQAQPQGNPMAAQIRRSILGGGVQLQGPAPGVDVASMKGGYAPSGGYSPQPQYAPGGGYAGGGGYAAGGITGGMNAPWSTPPSVAGNTNPFDMSATVRAQEDDRNRALAVLYGAQQGIGGSALARNVEGAAANLAANPDSISEADQRLMEARAIDENATRRANAQRELAEDLGGTGRLGGGAGIGALRDTRLGYDQGIAQQLRDIRLASAQMRGADRRSGLASAQSALGTLGNLSGASASEIARVFTGTERPDSDLARMMFLSSLGAGGGVSGSGYGGM